MTHPLITDAKLTSAQLRVLEHVAAGEINKIIAYATSVAESTVKAHVERLYKKTGLYTRAELTLFYLATCSDEQRDHLLDGIRSKVSNHITKAAS